MTTPAERKRYLVVGPRPSKPNEWLSMSRYTAGVASVLEPIADVETLRASHWNPPALARRIPGRYRGYTPLPRRWPGRLDLVHFTDPYVAVHARRFAAPTVATIHDLIVLDFTPFWPPRQTYLRSIAFRSLRALRHLDALIAPSGHTRARAIRETGFPADRLFVVPVLVPEHFAPPPAPAREERTILSVGTAASYKNLPALLHALADPALAGCRLIRVGASFPPELQQLAARLGVSDRIDHRGHVPEDQLLALMHTATVLAQPSLTEGFGMPAAEAMACGLPVVASNGGALPEVVGSAGRVVSLRRLGPGPADLDDARDFAHALAAVIEDPALQGQMSATGVAEAGRFRAPAVRERLLEAYSAAAAR